MKQTILFIAALLCGTLSGFAQSIVYTGPGNKHVVLEEFTGIKCVNCPSAHTLVESLTASNPDNLHVITYSPTNSSYTNPSGTSGTDFRRSFPDAFYTASYCSPGNGSRFMPSGFINRKVWSDGNLLQSRGNWQSYMSSTMLETSPMNLGLKSTYDTLAQTLTIDVEVYYTATVTAPNSLFVLLSQDSLTSAYQSGASASAANPYIYKNTFREHISQGQWGDPITGPTTVGSLFTTQYVFGLPLAIEPIDVANAHILAFVVEDNSNKEIYTGIHVEADGGEASTGTDQSTGIADLGDEIGLRIFPNPTTDASTLNFRLTQASSVEMEVYNSMGSRVLSQNPGTIRPGEHSLTFDGSGLPGGTYFVKLNVDGQMTSRKILLLK
jgi:hypothetical protein